MRQLTFSSEGIYVKEYLKYAWDSEYKYTVKSVENVTPHTISAALKFHCAKRLGSVWGTLQHWLASSAIPLRQRSDGEIRVGGLSRQMHKVALSDFLYLPCFNWEGSEMTAPGGFLSLQEVIFCWNTTGYPDFAFKACQRQLAYGRKCQWNVSHLCPNWQGLEDQFRA